MKKIIGFIFKVFIYFFIILTFILLYLSLFKQQLLFEYIEKIKVLIMNFGYGNYFIIFIFGFIESFPLVGVAIPGQTVLLLVAGFLGYKYIYISILLAFLGAILGNYLGYIMGIKYGENFFKKYGNYIGIGITDMKYIKKGIYKYGILFVIFGKFHNLLRAFVPFIAGSSGMKNVFFAIANIIGSLLRAIVMVLLGVFFVENAEIILKNIGKIILFIIILFVLYIYFFKKEEFQRYFKEKEYELDQIMKKKYN